MSTSLTVTDRLLRQSERVLNRLLIEEGEVRRKRHRGLNKNHHFINGATRCEMSPKARPLVATFVVFFCVTTVCLSRASDRGAVVDRGQLARIKLAVQRRLCFEAYWLDEPFRRGVPLPVKILIDTTRFEIRVDDLKVDATGTYWFGHYGGIERSGQTVVLGSSQFPLSPTAGEAPEDFAQGFPRAELVEDTLNIPIDCPREPPSAAEQNQVLERVVRTIQQYLATPEQASATERPAPGEGTLKIGKFNRDDPEVYVLVLPSEEVCVLGIHDPDGRDEENYQRAGYYSLTVLYRKDEIMRLKSKILQDSITRKVLFEPPAAPAIRGTGSR